MNSKVVMYIGRFVFGLGGENLAVACNTYSSSWFAGQALNLAFGFQLSIVRVGSAVCIQMMGPIYNAFLPDNCEVASITVAPITVTTELMTTSANISTTTYSTECEKEENKALGYALSVASVSVFLSLFGSVVAALLDKRREKFKGGNLEEQPTVYI